MIEENLETPAIRESGDRASQTISIVALAVAAIAFILLAIAVGIGTIVISVEFLFSLFN